MDEANTSGRDLALHEVERAYAAGNLVLVMGAALPTAAGLPSQREILALMLQRARHSKVSEEEALSELAELIDQQSFPEAFSAAKRLLGPVYGDVIERALGEQERAPPPLALAVAALAQGLRAVLTMNLDRLLERAFADAWPTFSRAPANLAQRRGFILKLQGTLEQRASWILTREEHARAMVADVRNEAVFSALFLARRLLFVGCDLDEPGLDAFLARMRAVAEGQAPRHFALVPSARITPYRRESLEEAGVRLIACELGEPVGVLEQLAGHCIEAPVPSSMGPGRCPFPGLEAFDVGDAEDFFGRAAEISTAAAMLGGAGPVHRRWLQIEGPSGAGKSSLARAGLVPAVTVKGWVHGAPTTWRWAVTRPGFDPLRSLAHALLRALNLDEVGVLDRVVQSLCTSDTALANLARERLPEDAALLVVIDQLEEVFTLASAEALGRFDAVLAEAVRDPQGRVYLVTAIRSDFVDRFEALQKLGALLNAGAEVSRYLLPPMSVPALQEAIERPAERVGLRWEAGLVTRSSTMHRAPRAGFPWWPMCCGRYGTRASGESWGTRPTRRSVE